jgi:hypothetical protein
MAEKSGFDYRQEKFVFLFPTNSTQALGFYKIMQWLSRDLPPDVKLLGFEADHSPSSRAEAKKAWRCTPFPPCVCVAKFVKFLTVAVIIYVTLLNMCCQGSFIT